jgi:hypothetical protein
MYQPMQAPQCRISMLTLMETGTYNNMYSRPFQSHVSPETMNMFQNYTDGGKNININTVSGLAGEILRPVSQVNQQTDLIDIPNGWGDRRFLFMLEAMVSASGFTSVPGIRQLIGGYTDYVGASNLTGTNVRLDPNMRLYINSVLTIKTVEITGPSGTYLQETVIDESQILNGPYNPGLSGFVQPTGDNSVAMRPMDVFRAGQTSIFGAAAATNDMRTNFAFGVKKSKRANNQAPYYIGGVAQAWQVAMSQGNDTDQHVDILGRAAGLVKDPLLVDDRFIKMLTDYTQFPMRGFVTYGELCSIQPGLDSITDVRYQDKRALIVQHTAGQSEHWHSAATEATMASILFQSIPAIMVSLMMVRATLMVTNRTLNGEYDIRPTYLAGFQKMPISEHLFGIFANRLRTEVLRDLTRNNLIDISFTITVDITNESHLEISVNGGPAYPFVVPSFCDGRFVPVLANNATALEHMSNDISQLCGHVAVDYSRVAPDTYNNFHEFNDQRRGISPDQHFNPDRPSQAIIMSVGGTQFNPSPDSPGPMNKPSYLHEV